MSWSSGSGSPKLWKGGAAKSHEEQVKALFDTTSRNEKRKLKTLLKLGQFINLFIHRRRLLFHVLYGTAFSILKGKNILSSLINYKCKMFLM